MVEALTIVLAVGLTRGWRSVRYGVAAAFAALAVVVAALGPTLTLLPLDTLRVIVGFLLLSFGLQWLRKAILRAAGALPLHDEEKIFEREKNEIDATHAPTGPHDWYAFTLSFKGVFLEGLEVAFLVVTFGAAHDDFPLMIAAAASALVVVTIAGVLVHRPLSRVPENTLKFGVGIMLTAFGTFWGAEGAGAEWPAGDAALVGLIILYFCLACALVAWLSARVGGTASALDEAA